MYLPIRKFDYHVRPPRLQRLCNCGGKRPSRNDIPDSCYDIKETVLIYCCLFIIIIIISFYGSFTALGLE